VPTVPGLRFFVDSLISVQPLNRQCVSELQAGLSPDMSPAELVEAASKLLSQVTHMAGLITLPKFDLVELRHVEFLPLSGDRVLVILVLNERQVQNRVIHTDKKYAEQELNAAANYINHHYAGQPLANVRHKLFQSMQLDKDRMTDILQTAVDLASKALSPEGDSEGDYIVAGEANLIDVQPDSEAMQKMFEAFAEKGRILHLLDRCLSSDGIQLFIGEESGYRLLDDMSLVTAPYEVNGAVAGVLGVIGPTRMAYQEVIPVVDVTARLLSAAIDFDSSRRITDTGA
jgi:heat-inducible transcriptional repressor